MAAIEMIFVILRPGKPLRVRQGTPYCIDAFQFLADEFLKSFEDPSSVDQARDAIDAYAQQCVDRLPAEMRDPLFGDDCGTIVLAPCGQSSLCPLETLQLSGNYFALRKVVSRVQGLGELDQIRQRQPETPSAFVVETRSMTVRSIYRAPAERPLRCASV